MSATAEQGAPTEAPIAPEPIGQAPEPGPHPLTRRRIWLPLGVLIAVLNLPFLHYALRGPAKVTATVPFTDEYDRADGPVGENYFATGGAWAISAGALYSPGVHNNPLWLRAKLPRDVVVEFDARSEGNGDIKCELFGNGRDHASGYVLIFGGWNNTISTIARLDEHGADRKERKDKRVEKGRTYHFKVTRQGARLDWSIDGEPFLSWEDAAPLEGEAHDRFAFSTWATDVFFDRLSVRPL